MEEALEWTQVWTWGRNEGTLDHYLAGLPNHSIFRSQLTKCSLNHFDTEDDAIRDLSYNTNHKMRTTMRFCRSARCNPNEEQEHSCPVQYKLNKCEECNLAVVFQYGQHLMEDNANAIASPRRPALTEEMKEWMRVRLAMTPCPAMTLFSGIVDGVTRGIMHGPEPTLQQVQNWVKRWKKSNLHLQSDVATTSAFIDRFLYERLNWEELAPNQQIMFSETVGEGDNVHCSTGRGSEEDPFRIGVTCKRMLANYTDTAALPGRCTMVHLDSTYGVVNVQYPFFVIGFSDKGGTYHPFFYFCTSQRREEDVSWCLRVINRVCTDKYGMEFAPDYVMMDADSAQFNACSAVIPNTRVLMCWFHVMQNVYARCKTFRVEQMDTSLIFRGLYDIHMARNEEEATLNQQRVLNEWRVRGALNDAMRRFVDHFESQWVASNFFRWRSADGPRGYPKTNNPLEQYHKSLKSVINLNRNTTIMGMINGIISVINVALAAPAFHFNDVNNVRRRLKERHKGMRNANVFHTTQFVGNANPNFHVLQRPVDDIIQDLDQNDLFTDAMIRKIVDKIAEVNLERIERFGMPQSGWVVNTAEHTCPCLIWNRDGICVHVVDATSVGQLPCPGMPRPLQQYHNRDNRNQRARPREGGRGFARIRSVRRRVALMEDGNRHQGQEAVAEDGNGQQAQAAIA